MDKKGIDQGAGEILLTSVDKDGTKNGFDIDLITSASKICNVPLIVSGGCGKVQHLKELSNSTHIDGIALGSILHYQLSEIKKIKKSFKILII